MAYPFINPPNQPLKPLNHLQLRLGGEASLDLRVQFVEDFSVHLDSLRTLEFEPRERAC